MQCSHEYLQKEIHRLKQDYERISSNFELSDERRTMDQMTVQILRNKFQELTDIFDNIKKREINTWHLVQVKQHIVHHTSSCH
jgi:archaellum component FlaC